MEESHPEGHGIALQIVTPTKMVADTFVPVVSLPGVEGDFGVMPGHEAFMTKLQPGIIEYEDGGMPRKLAVSGGIAEITGDHVNVMARTCEQVEEIDKERADKAAKNAETKLESMSRTDDEWEYQEIKLQRARARMRAISGRI